MVARSSNIRTETGDYQSQFAKAVELFRWLEMHQKEGQLLRSGESRRKYQGRVEEYRSKEMQFAKLLGELQITLAELKSELEPDAPQKTLQESTSVL